MKSSKLSISSKIDTNNTRKYSKSKLFTNAEINSTREIGVPRCDTKLDRKLQLHQEASALELESLQSPPKSKSASIMVIDRSPTSVSKQNKTPYSISSIDMFSTDSAGIKREDEVTCVLCASSTDDTFDIFCETTCKNVTLCFYICKVANLKLEHRSCSKYTCRSCYNLLNDIERAELEYLHHRDLLLDIISQNPALADLRECNTLDMKFPSTVSVEYIKADSCKIEHRVSSEDDEPLAYLKASHTSTTNASVCNTLSDDRQFSSDDDFTWKLESGEENCNPKKKKRKNRMKEKVNHKNLNTVVNITNYTKEKELSLLQKKNLKNNKTVNIEKQYSDSTTSDTAEVNADLKCDKCNRVFKKRCYLERHSHCKKPYICEVCGKGFKSPKLCNTHVLMHRGIADYKCEPCNKLFPTKVAFLRHDKIHNGIPCNQCDLCGKSFIHQSSLRMHKLAHAGVRKYTCDVCGLALLSNSMLTRHKLVHTGEKKYACDICGKKFARNSNKQTHMKTHMKDKPRPPTPPHIPGKRKKVFRCEICPDRFDRLFKLEIHLVDDHKVVLKKGRPKPRNTMKKLQRAQQAAASVVNSIATAMAAKRAADINTSKNPPVDVNSSVSKADQKIPEDPNTDSRVFKNSPHHQSMSPGAVYMSPPPNTAYSQESLDSLRMEYQNHQHVRRTTEVIMPALAFSMGAEYLSRIPDYSQN